MKKYILFISFLLPLLVNSQVKDTIYIIFDSSYPEIKKAEYHPPPMRDNLEEKIEKSSVFRIKQKEPANGYDNEFWFSHFNQPERAYKIFGGMPPFKIVKDMPFLKTIKPLDIQLFRTTAYIKVCKTFEAEDS